MSKLKSKPQIQRAPTPEAVGVDSREIQALLDDFIENNQEIHSVTVLRHGKIACEVYRDPFNPESKHMVYSVSKSFTSAAVGFAVSEGLLSLETKFLDIFPEMRPEKEDPYLEKLCVFDLLTMRSGKAVSVFLDRTKDSWLKDFVDSPWEAEPGTKYLYISENMYVLCAMLHKVTGMSVVDYLNPRLFEPLGIDKPYWETCPRGIETGGWGLMISTPEFAKFILCYQQGGKFNGKQVIPADWVEMSGKALSDNSVVKRDLDGMKGYGLCFWRCGGYEKAYRADGMFSQYGIIFEDLDACFICNAGDIYQARILETIWRHVPKCFIDDDPKADTVELSLTAFERLPVMPRSFLERKIEGRRITFQKAMIMDMVGLPIGIIPLPAIFMERDKAGNIDNVSFRFMEKEAVMSWSEGDEFNSVLLGMDGEYRRDTIVLGQVRYETFSQAAWLSEDVLEVRIRPIEAVAERSLVFTFNGNKVTVKPSSRPPASDMLDSIKENLKTVMSQKVVQMAADKVMPKIAPLVDSTLHGRMV